MNLMYSDVQKYLAVIVFQVETDEIFIISIYDFRFRCINSL